jgi:protein TonB
MFEQTFVGTQAATRKPWTVAVSLSLQCAGIAILLLIPLLHPENLRMPEPPQPHLIRTWITHPPLPPQRATTRIASISAPAAPRPFVFVPPNAHTVAAPGSVDIPSVDPELNAWSGPASVSFGPSLTGGTALPPRANVQPLPVTPAPKAAQGGPLRVGTGVAEAKLIFGPSPVYPPLAKIARSQGVVKLEATIAADGSIRNLRVVSGPPLLVNAAIEAVRQWRYRPTLLNGVAVEVLTEIDVNFSLTR